MEAVTAQQQHRWLHQMVGDWTYHGEPAQAEPGKPAETWSGTERVRLLGEIWLMCEATGDMPGGGTASSQLMLGYDPVKARYTGTFVGSMMTHLWVYDEGELDAEGRVLTMHADGPDFADPGKMRRYRDVFTMLSADERLLEAYLQGDDGQWQPLMRNTYRRSK
jgi:hypothetical protein